MRDDDRRLDQLTEKVDQRYYGKHRGTVTQNADPDGRGRLRLHVPSVLGSAETGWAEPCVPMGGLAGQGMWFLPEVGAHVWVEFEEGLIDRPLWVGTHWPAGLRGPTEADGESEASTPPSVRMLQTPSGHRIVLDDTADAERVRVQHRSGAHFELAADGACTFATGVGPAMVLRTKDTTVELTDGGGTAIAFDASGLMLQDANGNRIVLGASGVTIEARAITLDAQAVALGGAGGQPVLRGASWQTLFASHVHPTPSGPSGPPASAGMAPQAVSLSVTTM